VGFLKPGDRRDRLKYVQEQIEVARGGNIQGLLSDSDDSSDSGGEVSSCNARYWLMKVGRVLYGGSELAIRV
jgi:hypothetical protein